MSKIENVFCLNITLKLLNVGRTLSLPGDITDDMWANLSACVFMFEFLDLSSSSWPERRITCGQERANLSVRKYTNMSS